jgi:2',3'-cyclic-nucleotide 2'-phosphodiesterase (5'-nucleotidase family)
MMRWIAMALSGMLALVLAGGAWAATQSLLILHDNDIHGHLRSFCYTEVAKTKDEHCNIGGAARRATLIHQQRFNAPLPVLVVDSGDTTTRGPLATQYQGVDEIAAMNMIGYDLAAVGNNEFKLKDAADIKDWQGAQAALQTLIRRSHFPWICANVTDAKGDPLAGVKPYVVKRVGRVRIAFLGLTATRSQSYPQTKGLTFVDPVEAAKVWVPRARAEADIVIAVTHIGVPDDVRLAKNTRGIDAIIGGDSHTYLYQPMVQNNLDGQPITIVQDGEFGVRLGMLGLTMKGDKVSGWRIISAIDQLLPVDASVRPNPRVAALVEHYAHPLDVVVGRVPEVGATPAERTRLTALELAYAWKSTAGVDVGLQPEAVMFESFRTRKVTRYQIHAIVPFHDTLWRGQLTGAQLAGLIGKTTPIGGLMHATIALPELDPAKTYTVATTDFVAQAAVPGGVDTGQDARAAVEAWLAKGAPQ